MKKLLAESKKYLRSGTEVLTTTVSKVRTQGRGAATGAFDLTNRVVGSLVDRARSIDIGSVVDSVQGTGKVVVCVPVDYFRSLKATLEEVEQSPTDSEVQLLQNTTEKLKGRDKVGVAGEALITAGAAAGGAAVAGTVAGAFGATTILGSATLAQVAGGVLVVSTPLGWVVGTAAVAGAAGYGIAQLIRSGTKQDQVRKELVARFEQRLNKLKSSVSDDAKEEFLQLLPIAVGNSLITKDQSDRMLQLIDQGKLKPELALARLKALRLEVQVKSE